MSYTLTLGDYKETYAEIEAIITPDIDDINGYEVEYLYDIDMYRFNDEDDITLTKQECIDTVFTLLIYLDVTLENQHLLDRGFYAMYNDIKGAIDNRDYNKPFSTWLRTVIKPIAKSYKYM